MVLRPTISSSLKHSGSVSLPNLRMTTKSSVCLMTWSMSCLFSNLDKNIAYVCRISATRHKVLKFPLSSKTGGQGP